MEKTLKELEVEAVTQYDGGSVETTEPWKRLTAVKPGRRRWEVRSLEMRNERNGEGRGRTNTQFSNQRLVLF